MVWTCFSYYGVGPIRQVTTEMDQLAYLNILETVMLPHVEDEMPLEWVFQQDDGPNYMGTRVKEWLEANSVNVLDWPAQYPDLNPIENLWAAIEESVALSQPVGKGSLWRVIQESWSKIPLQQCQDLVESMSRRCASIICNKGKIKQVEH